MAILAGQFQHPALRQIHQPAALPDGGVFRLRFVERADDLQLVIRLKLRLGLLVKIRAAVAVVHFGDSTQHYFVADVIGGEFGTGASMIVLGLSTVSATVAPDVVMVPDTA
mgnify:CR=1 FL=1